jgi:hypothetical protein
MSDDKKNGGKLIEINFRDNLIGVEPESHNTTSHSPHPLTTAAVAVAVPVFMAGPSVAFLDSNNYSSRINNNETATSHVRQLTSPPPHMKLPCDIIREYADRKALKGDSHACQIEQNDNSDIQR